MMGWMMNWNGSGLNEVISNHFTRGTEEDKEKVRISVVMNQIQTKHLQNSNLQLYLQENGPGIMLICLPAHPPTHLRTYLPTYLPIFCFWSLKFSYHGYNNFRIDIRSFWNIGTPIFVCVQYTRDLRSGVWILDSRAVSTCALAGQNKLHCSWDELYFVPTAIVLY
jgi:hypothetical protein